jgi:hypothetical protein
VRPALARDITLLLTAWTAEGTSTTDAGRRTIPFGGVLRQR